MVAWFIALLIISTHVFVSVAWTGRARLIPSHFWKTQLLTQVPAHHNYASPAYAQRSALLASIMKEYDVAAEDVPAVFEVKTWLSSKNAESEDDDKPQDNPLLQLMNMFSKAHMLPEKIVLSILDASVANHRMFPNVLQIPRPKNQANVSTPAYTGNVTVVGDTHGQYKDFELIFRNSTIGGYPGEQNQFVINGDIVDRGPQAVEILMVLLFAKMQCPSSVHILRGNHEHGSCTQRYGFKDEVLSKYGENVYDKFIEFFDTLPVAAVVENSAFVVHGGLDFLSANASIAEINAENRSYGNSKLLFEMTWAGKFNNIFGMICLYFN